MNADGSNVTRLTDHPASDRSPSWSPDGMKIVFQSSRDGSGDIFLLDLQTRQLKNLTNHPSIDEDPAWSPDSSKIVFVSRRDRAEPKVYTMNPDGTGVVDLKSRVFRAAQSRPVFSPDGRRIIFKSERDELGRLNFEIYIMNKDGGDLRNLTQRDGYDSYAVWSPDGSQIAFLSTRNNVTGIYLMRLDGSDVRLLRQLVAEPHAWAAPSLIVGVESKRKLTMSWGEVKKLEKGRSQ